MEHSILLTSKFFLPKESSDYIKRDRLYARLDTSINFPVSIISAPTGYGKSTLVSSWLKNQQHAFGWLSISEIDNDPKSFLQYLIQAITVKIPSFQKNEICQIVKAKQLPPLPLLTSYFSNAFARIEEEFILVLDDFHILRDIKIIDLFSEIFNTSFPKFHLIIITRTDPALPLGIWRSKHRLFELRAKDLVFKSDEILKFIQKSTGLKPNIEMGDVLQKSTEGWPAGIRLFSISINSLEEMKARISLYKSGTSYQIQELVKDFLQKQDLAFQKSLIKMAIFGRFCSEICDYLNNEEEKFIDGQTFISTLEQSNLFIISLDNSRQWFRFHHLFKELLIQQFYQSFSAEDQKKIHIKAGDWYSKNGYFEEAIKHYLEALEYDLALNIFKIYRQKLLNQLKWQSLERSFNYFPEHLRNTKSLLILTKAWLHIYQFKVFEMFGYIGELQSKIEHETISEEEKLFLKAELNTLISYKTYNQDQDFKKCISQCEFAIQHLPNNAQYQKGYAYIFLIGSYQIEDGITKAIEKAYLGLEKEQNSLVRSHIVLVQSYFYWMEGDFFNLNKSGQDLINLGNETKNLESKVNGYYFLGISLLMQHQLKEAEHHLSKAYELKYFSIGVVHANILFAYSRLMLQLNRKEEAEKLALEVDHYLVNQGGLLLVLSKIFLADFNFNNNNSKIAFNYLKEANIFPLLPFSDFLAPQIIELKILLLANIKIDLVKWEEQLNSIYQFIKETNNNRFKIDILILKAIWNYQQKEKKACFFYLEQAIELGNLSNAIGVFLDYPPLNKILQLFINHTNANHQFIHSILKAYRATQNNFSSFNLSERELEVLELFQNQLTNKEIGNKLFIAEKTVKRHNNNIFKKLGVKNRREALQLAVEKGHFTSANSEV